MTLQPAVVRPAVQRSNSAKRWTTLFGGLLALACGEATRPFPRPATGLPSSVGAPATAASAAGTFAQPDAGAPAGASGSGDGGTGKPVVICEAIYAPSGVWFYTALPVAWRDLAASARVCAGTQCFDVPMPRPDPDPASRLALRSARRDIGRLMVTTTARRIDPRRLGLLVFVDTTGVPELQVDGTPFALSVRTRSGRSLIDVERTVRYDVGQVACQTPHRAEMLLSADSRSGIECSGHACDWAGFELRRPVSWSSHDLEGAELTLCRNALCDTGTFEDVAEAAASRRTDGAGMQGYLSASALLFLDRTPIVLLVHDGGSSFEHGASDHYRVTLRLRGARAASTLYDRTVTYRSSYPNGPECDAVPCRHLAIDACGPQGCQLPGVRAPDIIEPSGHAP